MVYFTHNLSAEGLMAAYEKVAGTPRRPIVFDAAGMCYRALGEVVGKAWGAGKAIAE